jgi:hypothetical protein
MNEKALGIWSQKVLETESRPGGPTAPKRRHSLCFMLAQNKETVERGGYRSSVAITNELSVVVRDSRRAFAAKTHFSE